MESRQRIGPRRALDCRMLEQKNLPGGMGRGRPVNCEECTIQIGDGYQESVAFEFVEDEAVPRGRVMRVCWRCWESLTRRKARRLAEAARQNYEALE
jgi:hypothetical protein